MNSFDIRLVALVLGAVAIFFVGGLVYWTNKQKENQLTEFPTSLVSELNHYYQKEQGGLGKLNVAKQMMDNSYKYFADLNGKAVRSIGGYTINGYVVIYTGNDIADGTKFTNDPLNLANGQIAIGFITKNSEVEDCSNKGDGGNYVYLTGGSIANNVNDDAPICRGWDGTPKQMIYIGHSQDLQNLYNMMGKPQNAKWVSFSTLSGLVLPVTY